MMPDKHANPDEAFLHQLRSRLEEAHREAPQSASPPPDLWNKVLAGHSQGKGKTMEATIDHTAMQPRISPQFVRTGGRSTRQRKSVRTAPFPGYLTAAVLLVMAIVGALFVAGQDGPGGDDFGDLRYAAQPVSTEESGISKHTCPVTFQPENLIDPPMGWGSYDSAYGGDGLRVTLPSGGSLIATDTLVNEQGEIWDKFLFWSNIGHGGAILEVTGHRLDGEAPPLRMEGNPGYGAMAVMLIFPTTGCWKVTGTLGDDSVTFVMLVGHAYEVPEGEATPSSG